MYRTKYLPLTLFLCVWFVWSALAQSLPVLVRDSLTGEPLIGVTLRVLPAGPAAITDANGFASLQPVPAGSVQVLAQYVGYPSKTANAHSADTLRILLLAAEENLEEVVVQSTRTNSRVEDSPIKVEVLGRDDMDEENTLKPNNVASILGDYSGVQIQQTSLVSGNSGVRIQGLASRYTQILRDGMPLYAGLAGDFGILQVQPLDLQQIELIKNPASTLFGGGAIAGVVNFISKSPGAKPERSITLNQTTLGETNATAWCSGRKEKAGFTLFAGATRQNAKDVDGDGFSDVSRLRTATLHPRFFLYGKNKEQLAIGLTLTAESRQGGDIFALKSSPDAAHPYLEKNSTRRGILDLQWKKPSQNGQAEWTAKAAAGVFDRGRHLPEWDFEGRQTDWFSEMAYRKNQNASFRWVAGANFSGNTFQKRSSDSLAFGNFQNLAPGLFSQAAFHHKKWDAELGFRLDARPDWGVFPLPSAAVLYHLSASLDLRTGLGFGYAVPNPLTLAADFEESDPRRILAPDPAQVKAERSVGGNLEWNYHHLFGEIINLSFNQQFFYTRFGNPVTVIATANGFLQPVNADAPLTTTGLDHYLRMTIKATEIYLGYTFVLARQEWVKAQPWVPLTPRHRFAGVLAHEFGEHFRTGFEASWTGQQVREDGSKTPSYLFLAGMMGWKFKHFDLILNGENLLNYRQTRAEKVVLGTLSHPVFVPLWAPVEGRVLNLAVVWRT